MAKKKKTAGQRKAQVARKELREAHLSPEIKASFKAINIWVAAYYYDKNKENRNIRKMLSGCSSVRVNRRKLITLSERQSHRCCYCGGDTWHSDIIDHQTDRSESNKATLEHLLPASQGGTYKWDNLAMACSECNTARGNLPLEEFLASIQNDPKNPKTKISRKKDMAEEERKRIKAEIREQKRFKLFMTASWMFPEDYKHTMENISNGDVNRVFKGGSRPSTTRKKSMSRIRSRVKANSIAA